MYTLVVCGAKNPDSLADAAMFGDFMGIAMTMRLFHEECSGTYLSCFDLDGYFARGRTDIKFGQFGPDKRPLFIYEARKHSTRKENFFEQVDPVDLSNRVVNAIIQLSRTVKEGDVVDIFFQCHGTRDGQLRLGNNLLSSETIAHLLTIFSEKVQVNCVGSHCYSGQLVDAIKATGTFHRYAISACGSSELSWAARRSVSNRCRNFRFAQPFVQSLAKCKLPSVGQTEDGPPTLESHEDFIRQALRNVNNGTPPHEIKTVLTNEKEESLILLEELILRDQADVLHDPLSTHRRRRMEWPTLDLVNLRQVQTSDNRISASLVKREVDEAFAAAIPHDNLDFCDQDDWGISGEMQKMNSNYEMLLNNLYWRGRQQSAIWDLYIVLVERGFLKIESLAYPINYATNPTATIKIQKYLNCFSFVKAAIGLSNLPFPGYEPTQCPTFWLAVMIGRGCAHEPSKMFETINFTGFLGKAELEDLEEVSHRGGTRAWHCDPRLAAGETFQFFGSWLPHGLGHDVRTYPEKILGCLNRFERVEKAYKQYYDLPDSVLIEESRQAEYLVLQNDS